MVCHPLRGRIAMMPASEADYERVLARGTAYSQTWLDSLGSRRVPPIAPADQILSILGGPLPENGSDALEVIDLLAVGAEPGLMAMGSGRFYGWVIGGTLPVALAADWLVSAWDQNTGLRYATPATAAIEEAASMWLLDLLGLPAAADVGFVTGGTMANFTCLAAARFQVFDQVGWNVHDKGLSGAPSVHVLVGAERHDTIDLALQYLGLGRPKVITSDDQGRIELEDLAKRVERDPGRRSDCAVSPSGQRPLRRLRSVRAGHRPGPRAGGVGARRRCVRVVGGGLSIPCPPRDRDGWRRFMGHRRGQDFERPL